MIKCDLSCWYKYNLRTIEIWVFNHITGRLNTQSKSYSKYILLSLSPIFLCFSDTIYNRSIFQICLWRGAMVVKGTGAVRVSNWMLWSRFGKSDLPVSSIEVRKSSPMGAGGRRPFLEVEGKELRNRGLWSARAADKNVPSRMIDMRDWKNKVFMYFVTNGSNCNGAIEWAKQA